MKAFKVNVYLETIEEITLKKNSIEDLAKHIGCETLDCIFANGLDFWVDDEALLQEPQAPCFYLKNYGKVTGNAVVLGYNLDTCESIEPTISAEELSRRIEFGGFQPSTPFIAVVSF